MTKHECCNCRHMKSLEGEYQRIYYFCMFSQSDCFMEETGVCSECELDDYAEELYQDIENRF